MRRAVLAVLASLAVLPCSLRAQSSLFTPKVEADPQKEYLITPEAGPWMISAAHYSGPNSHDLARQMVHHLRGKEGLPAFMFQHVNEDQKRRADEREKLRQAHPEYNLPALRVDEFWGVLIGGYPSVDAARKALTEVKRLTPPELRAADGTPVADRLFEYRPKADKKGYEVYQAPVNPFANAFVTRNPTVKQEAPAKDTGKEDQFLRNLNWGRPYSVYNCKKPYTLVIKDFGGLSVTQPRSASGAFFNILTLGKVGDMLDASGKQAEELARGLRESLKYDAYVLHRRHDSLVTVGAYESPDDPALLEMQKQIRNLRIGQLAFWSNPVPMPVPR